MKIILLLSFLLVSHGALAQNLFNFFKKENKTGESTNQYNNILVELNRMKDLPEENQMAVLERSEESLSQFVNQKKEECAKLTDRKTCHQELLEAVEQVMDKLLEVKKDFLVKTHKKEMEAIEKLRADYTTNLRGSLK